MKVWYALELHMEGENERDRKLDEIVGKELGFWEDEIDEREDYMLTALFQSKTQPTEMREFVRKLLSEHPEIYYIDMMYRFDTENIPDRFVIWNNGRSIEYTGQLVFVEDK